MVGGVFVRGGVFVPLQAGCEMWGVGCKVPGLPLEGGTDLGLAAAFWHRGTARCALGAPCSSGCRGPRRLGTGGARGSCLQSSAEQLLLWRVAAWALAAFPAPCWGTASRPSVSTKFLLISCPRTHPALSCSALPPADVAQPKIREVSKQGTQLITTSLLGAARLTPTDFIRRLNLIAAR